MRARTQSRKHRATRYRDVMRAKWDWVSRLGIMAAEDTSLLKVLVQLELEYMQICIYPNSITESVLAVETGL